MLPTPTYTASSVPVPAGAAFVIAIDGLNPASFTPAWFLKAGIVQPEELTGQTLVTHAVIELPTPNFHLQIIGNRIQIGLVNTLSENNVSILTKVLDGFAKNISGHLVRAVGINFDYLLAPPDSVDYAEWAKKRLASPLGLAVCNDEEKRPRFGAYFSANFEGVRMKVDIKPISLPIPAVAQDGKTAEVVKELVKISFNYHLDTSQSGTFDDVLGCLGKYDSMLVNATRVVRKFEE